MNAVTPYAPNRAGQSEGELRAPAMSRALSIDVDRMIDPDPAARALRSFDPRQVSPAQREEAEWAAEQFRALLAPVTRRQLVAWLGGVNAGCRNPQDEASFAARLQAIAQDCGHLPGACFTPETRRALYAETRFFPSAGDVLAVLEPVARTWQRKIEALDRIAATPAALPRPAPREERTAEAVAHVSALVASFKAEMQERREASAEAQVIGGGTRPARPAGYVLPPLWDRLADLEDRIAPTRALAMRGGVEGATAKTRLENMLATRARWRAELGMGATG